MNIKETKSRFKTGQFNKVEFIDNMHEFYKILFDFSNNLDETEISKIEIQDQAVIFTSRTTEHHPGNVRFYTDLIDKRSTPLEAFNFDQYEKEDSEILYKLVNDNSVIFDIGANIGWYSIHLAKKLPSSQIHSFEPIPETFNKLKKNKELNDSANIILNNFALSDSKKILSFYYSPLQTGASSSVNITGNSEMVKLECQTNTIDIYVAENKINKLDFIKCDVEGAEFFVYKGGIETIRRFTPIVFTEMLRKWAAKFDYHPNDIINFYNQFGYNCYASENGKLKIIHKVIEETEETNFFFLHPDKHKDTINLLSHS
jgi:FkbM family methyltransferase